MMLKLRKTVQVFNGEEAVTLRNPSFEVMLPLQWVNSTPEIKTLFDDGFLNKESNLDSKSANVIEALKQTGFMAFEEKDEILLRECRPIFDVLAAEWYAEYYTHPMWDKVRNGQLSHTGLLAWLIHNYHISIAAGITDARAACTMPTPELRSFFRENCLEEYWHCDAFYFVRHPNLCVKDEDIMKYVPLPSSTAFRQQAIRTAETDWIANILISYFQESSIRFYDDCLKFYGQVEKAYNIDGMFKPWLQHMSLDFEHSHADVLGELLEKDIVISKRQLMSSFRAAHVAFRFLTSALDEILLEDQQKDQVYLRNPVLNGVLDPRQNSFAPAHRLTQKLDLSHSNPLELYSHLSQHWAFSSVGNLLGSIGNSEAIYVSDQIAVAFFKALSYSSTHFEVILFGKLADKYVRIAGSHEEQEASAPSLSTVALVNFINDLAAKPKIFAFLLKHLYELSQNTSASSHPSTAIMNWLPISSGGKLKLDKYLASCTFSTREIDEACTAVLQINELINRKSAYDGIERTFHPFG